MRLPVVVAHAEPAVVADQLEDLVAHHVLDPVDQDQGRAQPRRLDPDRSVDHVEVVDPPDLERRLAGPGPAQHRHPLDPVAVHHRAQPTGHGRRVELEQVAEAGRRQLLVHRPQRRLQPVEGELLLDAGVGVAPPGQVGGDEPGPRVGQRATPRLHPRRRRRRGRRTGRADAAVDRQHQLRQLVAEQGGQPLVGQGHAAGDERVGARRGQRAGVAGPAARRRSARRRQPHRRRNQRRDRDADGEGRHRHPRRRGRRSGRGVRPLGRRDVGGIARQAPFLERHDPHRVDQRRVGRRAGAGHHRVEQPGLERAAGPDPGDPVAAPQRRPGRVDVAGADAGVDGGEYSCVHPDASRTAVTRAGNLPRPPRRSS